MGTTELKSNLHALIDDIDNASLLESVYELLSGNTQTKEGDMWASLTSIQKDEVMQAYEESEDPSKLISHEDVLKDLE